MTSIKYRIAEYVAEFDTKGFEYYEGMTLDQNDIEPVKIISEYNSKEEGIKELSKLENYFSKHSYTKYFYEVEEYILEEITYDEDGDVEDIEYIDTAKMSEDALSKYFEDIISVYGELVDIIKKENSEDEIKPVFKARGNFYTIEEFIKFENLSEYEDLEDAESDIYDSIKFVTFIKLEK